MYQLISPGGKLSKPYTREKIIEAYNKGKVPDGCCVVTEDGNVLVAAFCGIPPDEVPNTSEFDFSDIEDKRRVEKPPRSVKLRQVTTGRNIGRAVRRQLSTNKTQIIVALVAGFVGFLLGTEYEHTSSLNRRKNDVRGNGIDLFCYMKGLEHVQELNAILGDDLGKFEIASRMIFPKVHLKYSGESGLSWLRSLDGATKKPIMTDEIAAIQFELLALAMGTDEDTQSRVKPRILFLQSRMVAAGFAFPNLPQDEPTWPDGKPWQDDNSTREACLQLANQLVALAKGRGIASLTMDSPPGGIQKRMEFLRGKLLEAGYEFDDAGYENTRDENFNPRKGYHPLLPD